MMSNLPTFERPASQSTYKQGLWFAPLKVISQLSYYSPSSCLHKRPRGMPDVLLIRRRWELNPTSNSYIEPPTFEPRLPSLFLLHRRGRKMTKPLNARWSLITFFISRLEKTNIVGIEPTTFHRPSLRRP